MGLNSLFPPHSFVLLSGYCTHSPLFSRVGCPSTTTPCLSALPQRRRRRRRKREPLAAVVLNVPVSAVQTIPGPFYLDSCDQGLFSQAERSRPQGHAHPPREVNHPRAHRVANERFYSFPTPFSCFIGGTATWRTPRSMLLTMATTGRFPPSAAAPRCWRWSRIWNVSDRDEADAADTRNPQGSEHEGFRNSGAYPLPEQGHRGLESGTRRHVLVRHGLVS